MKRYLGIILVLIGFISINFLMTIPTFAKETSFSVKAKIPAKQWDQKKTYFDLRVTPGEVEKLEVELRNNTDAEVKVGIQANSAVTVDGGVIDYEATDSELDETMEYPFSEMVEVDSEVTLAPKETKTIAAKLTVPEESFDGIILGSLYFTEMKETKSSKTKNETILSQVIGVQLSENDHEVTTELDLIKAKAGQIDNRNVVLATVQNPTPKILSNMVVTADVFKGNNKKKPIYHNKKENLNMAPNSTFDYSVSTEDQAFKAGNYVMKMTIEVDGEKLELEQKFEIKKEEADQLNAEMIQVEQPTHLLAFVIIGFLVLICIIAGVAFWLARQKQQQKIKQVRKKGKRPIKRTKKPANTKARRKEQK